MSNIFTYFFYLLDVKESIDTLHLRVGIDYDTS